MSQDSLSAPVVLNKAASLAPVDAELAAPIAVLAVLVHAIHTALEFRLHTPTTDGDRLPASWLANGARDGSIALEYRHPRSSMAFEVKLLKLGNRIVINAIAVEDDKTKSFELLSTDYFSTAAFPVKSNVLASAFTSEHRASDFISAYRTSVLVPLWPDLQKDGYTAETSSGARGPETPYRGGYYPDAGGPLPGGRPIPVGGGVPDNPVRFPDVGRSDLDPLGGLGGTFTGRLPGGLTGGDGMIVGPDHPLFRDRFDPDPLRIPGRGDPRFLPHGAVPPGARFDPIGPGGPFPAPNRGPFGRGGSGFGGAPRGPFGSGDPDWDDLPPPGNEPPDGYRDMFG